MAKKITLAVVVLLVLALIAADILQSVALRNDANQARAASAAAAERAEELQKELAASRDQIAVLQSRLNERKDEITILQEKVAALERRSQHGVQFPRVAAPGAPIQIPLPGVQQRDVQGLVEFLGPDVQGAVNDALQDAGATVNFNNGRMTIHIVGDQNGFVVQPPPPPAPQPKAEKEKPADKNPKKLPGNF